MSRFVDVEWFGRDHKIGIVLTYDEHDGFKVRMAPLPSLDFGEEPNEEKDVAWLMENAAKVPFEWAWGIWGSRMKAEWMNEHLADDDFSTIRYDSKEYSVHTLEEVKS